MRPGESPKVEAERHRRILRAVELREQNKSYPEIAVVIGCSVSTAYSYVWTHLDRIDDEASEKLEKLRNRELARIERVIVRLWGAIENPDDEIATKAAAAFLKGSERRAKLLGLDAPTKHQEVPAEPLPDSELADKLKEALATVEQRLAGGKEARH